MDQVHWKGQSQEEQKDITEAPPRISCPHRHCSRRPLLHLDCQAGPHPPLLAPRQGCVDLGHHWNRKELSKHTNIQCIPHLNNWSLPELYVNAVTVPKCPSSGESGSPGFWFQFSFMTFNSFFYNWDSAFFYAPPMKPSFFWLRRTRLIWIISPPYPEVTLDTFGFPVGGRLAARRAVFRPRLPKVALFGPKSGFFGQKSIFCPHPPISSLPS